MALVHPDTDRRRWYVVGTDANGDDVLWFLDSGYTFTTCDDDFVDALGLPTKGRVVIRGELGRTHGTKATLPPMTIGDHRMEGLSCIVRDLAATSSIKDPARVPVAGVLGVDVMRRFFTVFDAGGARMNLSAPLPTAMSGERLLRESPIFGRSVVRAQLGDRTQRLIIDTGAANTHVNARRARLPLLESRTGTVHGTGGTGSATEDIHLYTADPMGVGPVDLGSQMVVHRQRASAGLLGLDALRTLRFQVDFEHGKWNAEAVESVPPMRYKTWTEARPGHVFAIEGAQP